MKPTIGRIVHYRLTKDDAAKTTARRKDAREQREQMARIRPGFQAHVGNAVKQGDVVPMLIVAVLPDKNGVNGQAFLDGNDSLWVTSTKEGRGPGEWSWPPKK